MKTGDSANITLKWNKDGTSSTTTNACTEVDATNEPGLYKVTLTATEAQCAIGRLGGKSSTSGIVIIPIQYTFIKVGTPAGASIAADIASIKTDTGTTIPGRLPAALAADGSIKASIQSILGTAFTEGAVGRIAAGFKALLNVASPVFDLTSVIQSGDSYSRLGAPAGASVSADVASIKTDTSGTATKLGGITLLKHWLGAIMGKQSADATALTEIRASGAGGAAYQNLSNVQATKVLLAVLAGQTSGLAGATAHMKKLDGSADVVVASIDADGNRGVPTLTP
jgi:hypothetical protein